MKSMSPKMRNDKRNREFRFDTMELIRNQILAARENDLSVVDDEMILAIYAIKKPDSKDFQIAGLPLCARHDADPEHPLTEAFLESIIKARKDEPEVDLESDFYNVQSLLDWTIDLDEVYLLAVALVNGARSLDASITVDNGPQGTRTGYSVMISYADQSSVYLIGKANGQVVFTGSSHDLPIRNYSVIAPVDISSDLWEKGRGIVDHEVSEEAKGGGPLMTLARLHQVLTATPADIAFL